jgi:hypothetical protein
MIDLSKNYALFIMPLSLFIIMPCLYIFTSAGLKNLNINNFLIHLSCFFIFTHLYFQIVDNPERSDFPLINSIIITSSYLFFNLSKMLFNINSLFMIHFLATLPVVIFNLFIKYTNSTYK